MHAADISAALKKAGGSQSEIARKLGIGKSSVNGVILGRITSKAVESEISAATGIPLHILWPNRYAAEGQPAPSKAAAPDPLEALLIAEFRKLDLARKARVLQLISELGGAARESSSASVVIHGQSENNQFMDMRGSSAPVTVKMRPKK